MTQDLRYRLSAGTLRRGRTVRWRNTTSVVHTVTADPEKATDPSHAGVPDGAEPFDSGMMPPGDTFEPPFTTAGDDTYFCIPHDDAGMIGTVTVTP
ncbi:MAG: cupredoxin domain-containing protein [Planctomycetota bacterium]